jgi:hypothetical protein
MFPEQGSAAAFTKGDSTTIPMLISFTSSLISDHSSSNVPMPDLK